MSKISWLIAAFFAAFVAIGLYLLADWTLNEPKIQLGEPPGANEQTTPLIHAGRIDLQVEPVDTDQVQPNEKVIGITVGGKARAYLLAKMNEERKTVVNDLVDGTPVTVTYYPIDSIEDEPQERIRVVADEHGNEPLVMGLAGIEKGKMMLYCQRWKFLQMNSKIRVWHDENQDKKVDQEELHALVDLDFEVITWGEWKKKYPGTDIWIGKDKMGEVPPTI